MTPAHLGALACFTIVAAGFLVVGAVYLTRSRVLPYHEPALPAPWSDLDVKLRVALIGMLRVVGGGQLAAGIGIVALLAGPFRDGVPWAGLAIALVALAALLPSLHATWTIRRATGAKTPLGPAVAGIVLVAAGTVLSIL